MDVVDGSGRDDGRVLTTRPLSALPTACVRGKISFINFNF